MRITWASLFIGIFLIFSLIIWQGIDSIETSFAQAGWGLIWITPYFIFPLLILSGSWNILFPKSHKPKFKNVFFATWIGTAINWLLPVAQIGGDISKAIWLSRRGSHGAFIGASTLVDKTLQAFAQLIVSFIGIAIWVSFIDENKWTLPLTLFSILLFGLIYLFYLLQKRGLASRFTKFALRSTNGKKFIALAGSADKFDAYVREIYKNYHKLFLSLIYRVIARLLMAGETWFILYLMGHPVSIIEAVLIETIAQTIKAAAFLVPGGYGVQEGGVMIVGTLLGIPTSLSLSLVLAKRSREIIIAIPALCYWYLGESRLTIKKNHEQHSLEIDEPEKNRN